MQFLATVLSQTFVCKYFISRFRANDKFREHAAADDTVSHKTYFS